MAEEPLFDLIGWSSPDPLEWWGFESPPIGGGAEPDREAGLFALPPIAGGAPGPGWADVWDTIQGIITSPWELAKKVGEVGLAVWDAIWSGIGGALRWLWEWMVDTYSSFTWWLSSNLSVIYNSLFGLVAWAKDRVWERVGDVKRWVDDAAAWGRDRLWEGLGAVSGWLTAGWNYLAGVVRTWSGWIADRVTDSAEWVRDRLVEYTTGLWENIWQAANWIKTEVLTPIMGAAASVADRIGDAFEFVGEGFLSGAELVGGLIRDALTFVFTEAFEPLVETIEFKLAIPGKLLRGEYEDLFDLLEDVTDPAPALIAGLAGALLLAIIISLITAAIMTILVQPLCVPHVQAMQARVGAALLSRMDLQEVRWRDLDVDLDDQLARMGHNAGNRAAIAELDKRIPAPPDLVRMAVREAFDKGLAEDLGYVTPLPGEFGLWLARQGYGEEWAERWWWAHWDLPSVGQGMEMFHRLRDEFGVDQLRQLLKVLDIPPLWHDRFIKIAYQPITRVDIRRIFKLGLLSEGQIVEKYQDLGYSPEDAQLQAEFTKRYSSPDEDGELKEFRDLAQGTIRQGYRRHALSREEALDMLVDAGYMEDVADFLLTLDDVALGLRPDLDADVDVRELTTGVIRTAYRDDLLSRTEAQAELEVLGYMPGSADLMLSLDDLDQAREITELEVGVIREEFLADAITREEVVARLDDLGLGGKRRELLVKRWEMDKAQTPRRLSVAQLQTGWRYQILDDGEFVGKVQALGYTQPDSEYILSITAKRRSLPQLQRLVKAGEIGEPEFLAGVAQLGYKAEDALALAALTMAQLTLGQLREGLRQGVLEEGVFRERAVALGYGPDDVDLLVAMVAPPPVVEPSVGQLQEGLRRELISEAEFLEAMVARGYTEEDAGFLAGVATRSLSVTQLQKGYKMRKLTAEELVQALGGIGYSPDDAQYLLSITEQEEEEPEEEV